MCLFLLLPEFGRLANVFVLNRPVGPAQIAWPWQSVRRLKIARYIVKPLYVGVGLFIITNNALSAWKTWGDRAPFPPLYGMYQVEPGASPDTWRRVFVNRHHMFLIELADRSRRRMAFEDDGHGAVTLRQPTGDKIKFTYSRPDPDHLHIQGEFEKQRVDARLRKLPSADFLLLNRGFHWINEFPFNR
jgi:hypothetical protein